MYGLILKVVETLIVDKLGQDGLERIRKKAGIDEEKTFLVHENYCEEFFDNVLTATVAESGLPVDAVLELAGQAFFNYCQKLGHSEMLRSLGYDLPSFLSNLDALHDHLSYTYPEMKAPSFRCSDDNGTLLLHYYSFRQRLESVVVGVVKAVGRAFLGLDVSLEVKSRELLSNDSDFDSRMKYYVVFEVRQTPLACSDQPLSICPDSSKNNSQSRRRLSLFHNNNYNSNNSNSCGDNDVSLPERPWPVTRQVFAEMFPFHIMFSDALIVTSIGKALNRLIPFLLVNKSVITEHLTILRPQIAFNVPSIKSFVNSKFKLALKTPSNMERQLLIFKGQMIILSDNSILFIGSPQVHDLEEMKLRGLYLCDYPLHDSARDLMMINNQLRVEKRTALMLEQTKQALEYEKKKVTQEKERADYLLHAMLPVYVANQLQAGLTPEATDHTLVSILFSDIKGFTTICNSCQPLQIVHMLNQLYTAYDDLTERHNVYKVETIGDAYMVASGLLETAQDHADALIQMAFHMRTAAGLVRSPNNSVALEVRIGIHTGPVVSGVVGTKMPRFCLFGDTVNTASRMESHGLPGRVHISQKTYEEIDPSRYMLMCRKGMAVKGLGHMVTYFVEPQPPGDLNLTLCTSGSVQSYPSPTESTPAERPAPTGQEVGDQTSSPPSGRPSAPRMTSTVCQLL